MNIQINTDHTIAGSAGLTAHVESVVEASLGHFQQHITRVEVHLTDENGNKSGTDDKRCMMEARLEGQHPTAVTHHAGTVDDAVEGAAEKLKRSVESKLGRLRAR
ncbi:MAG: HPF/RaiA family ribosome-associated protein [Byssovorax sp.]